jgi:CRP-like cAMP-binding protein
MGAPMTTAAVKSRLAGVPLFSGLTASELEFLASSARSVSFRKGARVFEEGALADCCYVLVEGRAKVVLNSEDGGEVLLNDVAPGDLVGEVALLDGFTRSAALLAMEPCHFIVIAAAAFDTLRANPAFERTLVARVMSTLRDTTERVRRVSTGPSIARVAWCLGRIASREGKRDGKVVIIPKKPHQDLAAMAGCTRETVSRSLRVLKRKKCVSWDTKTMRLEVDCLQRYVHSEVGVAASAPATRI